MLNKICIVLFTFVALSCFAERAEIKPNIILIILDDVSADDLSIYGNDFISLPNNGRALQ